MLFYTGTNNKLLSFLKLFEMLDSEIGKVCPLYAVMFLFHFTKPPRVDNIIVKQKREANK